MNRFLSEGEYQNDFLPRISINGQIQQRQKLLPMFSKLWLEQFFSTVTIHCQPFGRSLNLYFETILVCFLLTIDTRLKFSSSRTISSQSEYQSRSIVLRTKGRTFLVNISIVHSSKNDNDGLFSSDDKDETGYSICRAKLATGEVFIGRGKNRKLAKYDACQKAVNSQKK